MRECPGGLEDPLAHLRGATRPWGKSRVILWAVGSDRIAAMKAVRETLGRELEAAKDALEGLPKEILVDVDTSYAERAVQLLREAGCDAEAVIPARRTTRD